MTMDLYCVMGNPVQHSKSPWIHARFAELTGQTLQYDKRLVPLDGLASAVQTFIEEGGRGCNITVPFKFEAARLASHTSGRAALAQACNVLSFTAAGIVADNTDGAGLVNDIQRNAGLDLSGRHLLLIGAGGAAAGVLGPLIQASCASISVANRTLARAAGLVQRHRALADQHRVALHATGLDNSGSGFDLVINSSASSLAGGPVPVPASVLRPNTLAVDLMYGPAAQPFLAWAAQHGAIGRDGLGMLVEQAAEAFLLWRGVRPSTAPVLAALRARLAAKA